MDFKNLQKCNFCETKFFFSSRTSSTVYIQKLFRGDESSFFPPAETQIAILKFLSSLFSYISFKSYLGSNISCCSGLLLKRKVKNLFLLVTFFLGHSLHTCNPLVTSFLSYPALDNKVVIRFLKAEGRGGASWFLWLLKYQYCTKYDLQNKIHQTGALN